MGIDFSGPGGYTVIDIGAGTTDIAVLSLGRLAKCESVKIAGCDIDNVIISYIKSKYNINIGIHTAQMLKHKIGSVIERPFEISMIARGINTITLMPDSVEITDRELFDVISDTVNNIFSNSPNFLILVIEHAMTVTLKVGVCDLLPEFLADALVILGSLQSAGAVSVLCLQPLFNSLYHFLIFVQTNCHTFHILSMIIVT